MAKRVVVVGATGAVGENFISILEQRDFPISEIKFVASARSAGRKVAFKGRQYTIEGLSETTFDEGWDIALFSIPKAMSRKFAPIAASKGCFVIDNSNAFRMEPDVPLVVPEVNGDDVTRAERGIIANPNCSTIGMVVAVNPLHKAKTVKRLVITTMQSVSGVGLKAIEELRDESAAILAGEPYTRSIFPHQMAFNVLPQIPQSDAFGDNGYTSEEMKLLHETRKIMHADAIRVTMTCTRVPVIYCHSEAINIEFEKPCTPDEARKILAKAPGVTVVDDVSRQQYPLATDVAGKDDTYVGRIRQDESLDGNRGINLWLVSDNLRKGAALNAVQIAETLVEKGL
ncbi:MAG: aspartate-semialdehyde dehydrogenase [Planctomycetes bacterium]|nr:aspartate-semialdehyde dehydrogenase [Planctomycetota bacterium]